ncbi:hypothetical protein E5K00_15745 [Hymenobacter aquaticus]|uniref:Uncharacterized protein n=1 Tax=Hymenobacter aquaticus TaxID=1867101 RepID=A0A4Z0PWS2_9BACT|nr:hypothetical protein [Hymenobacter aquaticus]TGE21724.1 hypothetical protein E5K00_15745 [Hymenobacter aquaticus]
MAYSVNKLTTPAQCDAVLALIAEERENLDLQQRILDKRRGNLSDDVTEVDAELTAKQTELASLTTLINGLADGDTKTDYERRRRTLSRRITELQDRQLEFNPVALIDREFDVARLTKSLAEADTLEAEVKARKAVLEAAQ